MGSQISWWFGDPIPNRVIHPLFWRVQTLIHPRKFTAGTWKSHLFAKENHLNQSSGQILATSHDLTPKCSWERDIPLFQANLGWWNSIIWPESFTIVFHLDIQGWSSCRSITPLVSRIICFMVQASETLRRISQEIKPDDIHQAWVGGKTRCFGVPIFGEGGEFGWLWTSRSTRCRRKKLNVWRIYIRIFIKWYEE